MSDPWRIESDLNNSYYHHRIYVGETLIMNVVAVGSAGRALAEQIVPDHNTSDALAAAQAQVARLQAALEPIMAYLDSVDRNSDPDGTRISDKLDGVNDVWLRRADIAALRAALTTSEPSAEEEGVAPGPCSPDDIRAQRCRHFEPSTEGPADHGWAYMSRPENRGMSIIKPCCDRPQSEHVGVSWGEFRWRLRYQGDPRAALATSEPSAEEEGVAPGPCSPDDIRAHRCRHFEPSADAGSTA